MTSVTVRVTVTLLRSRSKVCGIVPSLEEEEEEEEFIRIQWIL